MASHESEVALNKAEQILKSPEEYREYSVSISPKTAIFMTRRITFQNEFFKKIRKLNNYEVQDGSLHEEESQNVLAKKLQKALNDRNSEVIESIKDDSNSIAVNINKNELRIINFFLRNWISSAGNYIKENSNPKVLDMIFKLRKNHLAEYVKINRDFESAGGKQDPEFKKFIYGE